MTRLRRKSPRAYPHHGDRTEYDALVAMTDRCEFCGRHKPLEPHHAAQGFRPQTMYLVRLLCLVCQCCHRDLHKLAAEDGRACALAIVYLSCRGNNTELFWKITGRQWPAKELVELWIDRLTGRGNRLDYRG